MFGLAGFVHFTAFAGLALAQTEPNGPELIAAPQDEIERWVPSFSASLGMLLQRTSGDFVTGDILDPAWVQDPVFFPSRTINPPGAGEDLALTPAATFSLEFMTPGLLALPGLVDIKIPGRPRLFIHADAVPTFGPLYSPAKEGNPKPHTLPFDVLSNAEPIVTGQGGVLQLQVQRWQLAAGAGVALTVDLWDRRFRIKPSLEYMTQEVAIDGEIRRAAALVATPYVLDDFRFIHLTARAKKRFHGLGAGIEFEHDTRRTGPLLLSVFASARGYRFMGDLDLLAVGTNSFGETATFRARTKRYAYRGSVGVRLRFAPN